ncbi:MAG: signal peptide peptidase SppA [Desulfuromonas sp.]|nr:MAG: signal peptide peptidase SppA [Desulfuromonas sp.]
MKKRPFLMASATIGAIFLFFLLLILASNSWQGSAGLVSVGDKVGVLEVIGPIEESKHLIDQIHAFRDNDAVKAVVLRVDSPGGGVGPSQEIYTEIKRLTAIKPVVVSMGSVAASGGYYIAAPAQRIFANPGTITGSIGVIMSFANYQELMDKVGVKSLVIKSGPFKDTGSATRPFTDEENRLMQLLIDDVHAQFVEAVSEGRNLTSEVAAKLADGRIYTGRQAQNLGLVDEQGNLQDAIDYAAAQVGLEKDPDLLYPRPEEKSLLDRVLESSLGSLATEIKTYHNPGLSYLWPGF